MASRVLITGGAGFLGSAIARSLASTDGLRVTVIDDLSAGNAARLSGIEHLRLVEGSILDERALDEAFADRPDVVVHMAASFANQRSVEDPLSDLRTNAEGTLRLLARALAGGVGLFVHASSSCVYGDAPGPLDEVESPLRPYTPYAVSKLAAEQMVAFYCRYHDLPAVVLRYFNCYGPGEEASHYRGVVARFVRAALLGEPLVVTGSGNETRQFLFLDDAARATVLAIRAGSGISGTVLNVASGRSTGILDLARTILEVSRSRSPIHIGPARAWDVVRHRAASTRRAEETIGFTASTPLRDGLRTTVDCANASGPLR
ncbi:MAG: NAD-dependent epimerase/dehydratase family protein [Deltaproteobacteria bacterium]|nr:NAD-dependent epimerase/dehydratase family protein [Deltaproteobacteria bacterium]